MITTDVKEYVEKSVLCWLATCSKEGVPNVSPKEMFMVNDDNNIVIANIASPNSIRNIKANSQVCVSFIDIFVQRGYKVSGKVVLYEKNHEQFMEKSTGLRAMAGEAFPVSGVIELIADNVQPIVAPRYMLYPETTEEQQIEGALKTYGVVKP